MTRPIVRRAGPDDLSEWLRMRQLLWPEDKTERLDLEMQRILASPRKPVFVMERPDGRLAGFLEAGTREYADGGQTSPVAYIEGWFVDADVRRRGLGRLLVEAAEAWARSQGLQEIGSDTGMSNAASISAHKSLGYRDAEHLIHFIKKL